MKRLELQPCPLVALAAGNGLGLRTAFGVRCRQPSLLLLLLAFLAQPGSAAIPDNDNFETRAILSGTNVTATGSNVGATIEPDEPDPSLMAGNSVWWTWTAPADGNVTLSTAGSSFNTMLTVYTGTVLSNLTFVGFNDDDPNTLADTSWLTFNVTAGTAYQISVDGSDGPTGSIQLQLTFGPVQTPPPNDSFSNRIALSGTHLSNISGSNVGATKEPGEPYHADEVGGKSVWWTWTAPSDGGLTLATDKSTFATVLALYTGNSLSNLTFVAGNGLDPLLPTNSIGSRITCNVFSNTTYQIAVDGYDCDSGIVRMTLDLGASFPVPPNDNFSNRITLTGSSITTTGSNVGASFEAIGDDFSQGEPEHLFTFGGKSVWWTWRAPSSGNVTLTTDGSTFDTFMVVYTGNAFSNLVFVAGNDEDPLSPTGRVSRLHFNATNGVNYQIVVDGYDGDSGSIHLSLTMGSLVAAPLNDNFANRVTLSGNSVTAYSSTFGATFEPDEPLDNNAYGGKSAWWQWTSPGAGIVTVDTSGSDFDTLLGVYTGTALSNLVPIASSDNVGPSNYTSAVTFYTKSGVTYQISVDGYDDDRGDVTLHIGFTSAAYTLTVATNPPGLGSIILDPLPESNGRYAPDSVVWLTANASPGAALSNWTGSNSSTNNPLAVTMCSNKTITANFSFPQPQLVALPSQTPASIRSNGFRLQLSGPTSFLYSYAIDRTTNFSAWVPILTNQFTSTQSVEIRDLGASNSAARFYRARRVQ